MTLETLLIKYGPFLLKGIATQSGKIGFTAVRSWWRRRRLVRTAARVAAEKLKPHPGLRHIQSNLAQWADTSTFISALGAWLHGEFGGQDQAVRHFIRSTRFATGGGPSATVKAATLALEAFAAALVREHILAEGGSPIEADVVLGSLEKQAENTRNHVTEESRATRAVVERGFDEVLRFLEERHAPFVLDTSWFRTHVERSLEAAGDRYTPEVHVGLPAEELFGGISHGPSLQSGLAALVANVIDAFDDVESPSSALQSAVKDLGACMRDINPGMFPQEALLRAGKNVVSVASEEFHQFQQAAAAFRVDPDPRDPEDGVAERREAAKAEASFRRRSALIRAATEVRVFLQRPPASSAARSALLVTGEAGRGKTHLLCRAADVLTGDGAPVILALGQMFGDGDPWTYILREARFDGTADEFLDALNQAGERAGRRSLLIVDALNESAVRDTWLTRLPQMVGDVERYPHVALIVSVRSTYLETVIPENLLGSGRLVRYHHLGFEGHEQDAADIYFDHYGIVRPTTPILAPEFSNPLFLKLLCRGLHQQGYNVIPDGLEGTSALVDFFVDALDHKTALPRKLDLDPADQPARSAAEALAREMADRATRWLPRDEAKEIAGRYGRSREWSSHLYSHLVSEGLLREDMVYDANGATDVTAFTYERIGDHLIAQQLVSAYGTAATLRNALATGGSLHRYAATSQDLRLHAGLFDALAVQAPERVGAELTGLVPDPTHPVIVRAVVHSLLWRRADTITPSTLASVDAILQQHPNLRALHLHDRFMLAARPGHPLNADALHAELAPLAMPDRDALWTLSLEEGDDDGEPVTDRLIGWARRGGANADTETLRLAGLALAWLLASPNRPRRDPRDQGARRALRAPTRCAH